MSNGIPGKMVKGLVVAGALLMASGCQMLQSTIPAGDEEMPRGGRMHTAAPTLSDAQVA